MSDSGACPKCGFAVSGAGFGMATCAQCGEIFLLGSEASPDINIDNLEEGESHPNPGTGASIFAFEPEAETLAPTPSAETIPAAESVSLKDLAEFGNQEQPSTSTGGLVFDLNIEGVNTAESRQDLADVLNDRRLGINVQSVLGNIKEGKVVIPHLNPVKASVLVGRLKHLSFEVSWRASQLVKDVTSVFLVALVGTLFASLIFFGKSAAADSWARHEVNLKGYQIQIRNGEEELRELILKKKQNTDPKVRDELLKEIIQKDQDLQKTFREMKAEEDHIRFQHPEKGDETLRKYRHMRLKSLEELENEVGVDGQLSRLKGKVKDKYDEP